MKSGRMRVRMRTGSDQCCKRKRFANWWGVDVTISAPAAPGCPACRYRLDVRAKNCARCGRDISRPASTPVQAEVLALTLIADWLAYRTFVFAREVLHYGTAWFELLYFDRIDAYGLFGFQVLFFGCLIGAGVVLDRAVPERRAPSTRYLRIRNAIHLALTMVASVTAGITLDLIWRLI